MEGSAPYEASTLVENSAGGLAAAVVELDASGCVRGWSDGAEALLGWAAAEVLGGRAPILSDEPTGELPRLLEEANAGFVDRAAVWQRRDGTPVELAVSASPIRVGSGEPSGVVLVARDVSERNAAMATFSHELRTPLAAILGFTEILMTRASDDDVNKTTLEMMHSEAKRLSSLMGQFLDAQQLPEVERLPRRVSPPGTESPRAPSRR